jgi:hypothetical protein
VRLRFAPKPDKDVRALREVTAERVVKQGLHIDRCRESLPYLH